MSASEVFVICFIWNIPGVHREYVSNAISIRRPSSIRLRVCRLGTYGPHARNESESHARNGGRSNARHRIRLVHGKMHAFLILFVDCVANAVFIRT